MPEDIVRVLRVIEYVGPRSWVETQVANSIQGQRLIGSDCVIRVATIGNYPEILEKAALDTDKERGEL